jgi:hypothetical protein
MYSRSLSVLGNDYQDGKEDGLIRRAPDACLFGSLGHANLSPHNISLGGMGKKEN